MRRPSGFIWQAGVATVTVLAINVLLRPLADSAPAAAAHHSVAAVLMPRTLTPSETITPAPRKPTPLTA
jgi:uncharacterized membrane protein YhiD involved in acid resistance